ncbi:MAG: hypothetical protein AVDCRST_MAG64-1336, partial [uncultured Phycisphaerae bacterium]
TRPRGNGGAAPGQADHRVVPHAPGVRDLPVRDGPVHPAALLQRRLAGRVRAGPQEPGVGDVRLAPSRGQAGRVRGGRRVRRPEPRGDVPVAAAAVRPARDGRRGLPRGAGGPGQPGHVRGTCRPGAGIGISGEGDAGRVCNPGRRRDHLAARPDGPEPGRRARPQGRCRGDHAGQGRRPAAGGRGPVVTPEV